MSRADRIYKMCIRDSYCAISDIEKGIEQSKRLIAAYEKQDLDAMLQLMEERDGNSCDPLPGLSAPIGHPCFTQL